MLGVEIINMRVKKIISEKILVGLTLVEGGLMTPTPEIEG